MVSPMVGDGTALIFGHCVLEGLDREVASAVVGGGARGFGQGDGITSGW